MEEENEKSADADQEEEPAQEIGDEEHDEL